MTKTKTNLNHLNVAVSDPDQTAQFFANYFGFRRVQADNPDTLVVLLGDDGFALALSHFDKSKAPIYPSGFHFGFNQDTKDQVDDIYQRLFAAGYAKSPPREFHGSWTFYFNAPGNVMVEVQCFLGH